MLKNDTLKNGMSRTGLYGSLPPGPERDSKVRDAKDYGKKFRSKLAASFSGIVHWHNNFSNGIDMIIGNTLALSFTIFLLTGLRIFIRANTNSQIPT